MKNAIGTLSLPYASASLVSDNSGFQWEAAPTEDREIDEWVSNTLNSRFLPTSTSPADGIPGRKAVIEAAEFLNGKASFPDYDANSTHWGGSGDDDPSDSDVLSAITDMMLDAATIDPQPDGELSEAALVRIDELADVAAQYGPKPPVQKSMPPTVTPPQPPNDEPSSLRPDDSIANGTPTDTALSHYSAITDDLAADPDHDALLSRTFSATDDAISSISAEMDAFEDTHSSLFRDTHGDTVMDRCADAHQTFIANCRNVVKAVAAALTDYADTLANAIQSHQSTGNYDPQPLADAHMNFKKTRLASKLDLRSHVRDADKTFAADATALDGEQLEMANNAATFLSNDPENDETELYNQELAASGNPYRVQRDETGQYSVIRADAGASDGTPATQKAITPGVQSWIDHSIATYRRRIPPALMSAGGIANPPPDLAAALNNLTTTTANLPAQIASLVQKKNKKIEVEKNEDGTHKAYKITEE